MQKRFVHWLLVPALMSFLGCAAGSGGAVPGDPTMPPPEVGAWRPAEAMAMLLKPPSDGISTIDEAYLGRTKSFRARMAETDDRQGDLRKIEHVDPGGRRTWYLDGADVLVFRVDMDDDGSIDQSQYFGPEGLYAITHRFGDGRRTQRIYWPPGEPRIAEIRDNLPPYPGVWWRTHDSPFSHRN